MRDESMNGMSRPRFLKTIFYGKSVYEDWKSVVFWAPTKKRVTNSEEYYRQYPCHVSHLLRSLQNFMNGVKINVGEAINQLQFSTNKDKSFYERRNYEAEKDEGSTNKTETIPLIDLSSL